MRMRQRKPKGKISGAFTLRDPSPTHVPASGAGATPAGPREHFLCTVSSPGPATWAATVRARMRAGPPHGKGPQARPHSGQLQPESSLWLSSCWARPATCGASGGLDGVRRTEQICTCPEVTEEAAEQGVYPTLVCPS